MRFIFRFEVINIQKSRKLTGVGDRRNSGEKSELWLYILEIIMNSLRMNTFAKGKERVGILEELKNHSRD